MSEENTGISWSARSEVHPLPKDAIIEFETVEGATIEVRFDNLGHIEILETSGESLGIKTGSGAKCTIDRAWHW